MTLHTLPYGTEQLIHLALQEDLGHGDVTCDHVPEFDRPCVAIMNARETMIVSGLAVAQCVFETIDPMIEMTVHQHDGDYDQQPD